MIMSFHRHRPDLIAAPQQHPHPQPPPPPPQHAAAAYSAKNNNTNSSSSSSQAKSIDKICAKLHLHVDPEKQAADEVLVVKNIKKEANDLVERVNYLKEKERYHLSNNHNNNNNNIDDCDLHHNHINNNNNDNNNNKNNNNNNNNNIKNHHSDEYTDYNSNSQHGDMDMYSSDSPKSSYNPCPSPTIIHDNPTMMSSYTKEPSSSPPLLTPISSSSCSDDTKYDISRHHNASSSVIVCTHDPMYDSVCPVSPVFVSTHDHDGMNMSYDNIHPSSPVIDHMLGKNSVSYTSMRTHSPIVTTSAEDRDRDRGGVHSSDMRSDTGDHDVSGVSMTEIISAPSPNSPSIEKSDTEKTEPNNNNNNNNNNNKSKNMKPRHTTQYNNWHHNDMIMAIKAVQMKYLSMTAAAKRYGIPRTTLRHYLHDGTNRETKRACFSLPKKSEEDLVEFALENCHVNEKALYKLIFDKAKEFSQEYVLESGEEGRRVVPTPAWIRRFVYRHKQLHSIFPTFLAKWEHPVLGDRKMPNDPEDFTKCNGSHDKMGSAKDKTEIIFPGGKYDGYYPPPRMYDMNGNKNSESSMSEAKKRELQSRHDNCLPPSKSLLSRSGNELADSFLVDSEMKRRDDRGRDDRGPGGRDDRGPGGIKAEQFLSDDERIIPYKDLLSRISKSPFTQSKITSSHNSPMLDLKYRHERNKSASDSHDPQQQYVNLSSIPIIRSSQYSTKSDSTPPTSISDMQIDGELVDDTNKSDVSYSDKLRSLVKPSSCDDRDRDPVQFSEFDVMKITLNAMEESLGVDYVQLFTERYYRNKSLERLYGKWVSLRSEIDLTD